MLRSFAICLFCAAAALPGGAQAEWAGDHGFQRLEALVERLTDPTAAASHRANAGGVMARLGLGWGGSALPADVAAPFVPDTEAAVELVDIRLLLTQIAMQAGARDHGVLLRAQAARRQDVILLRGGFATLGDLFALSRETPAQNFVIRTRDGLVLTRPLAIWPDAGLTLQADDQLTLDRASGSFVVNLGWLDIDGGTILSDAATNNAEPAFRPFVLTAGQGAFTARGATFRSLGFGTSTVLGGVAVVSNGLVAPRLLSVLRDSDLTDVTMVSLIGTTGAIVAGNSITGATGAALLVSSAHDLLIDGNTLGPSGGRQAIRVTAGSRKVRISNNILTGGARIGIAIDAGSHAVMLSGNLVADSVTTGISVDGATCVVIRGNLIASNGGIGVSLTDTDGSEVAGNAILFNKGSGVLVRDQKETARVRLTGNVLAGNRDGLRGATTGDIVLSGNDLEGQMPRVFAGDLAVRTVGWLRNRRLSVPVPAAPFSRPPCLDGGTP